MHIDGDLKNCYNHKRIIHEISLPDNPGSKILGGNMKKSMLCLFLALALMVGCLPVGAFADETTQGVIDDTPALTEPEPDLAEDAQAPQTDFAFGSVSIFNGCRTLDGQMPLAGSDRKLESAQSAIVYERNTKTLVYAYNPDMKLAPGSLSKVITALIVVERVPDLDSVVTVGAGIASRIPGGANSAKLKSEEQLTVRDLLHLLILQNAADAAVALAEYVAGTRSAFVDLMNQRVKQIGCINTSFTDVHGVGSGNQYTTARDMIRLMMEVTENPTMFELLSTQKYTVPATNLSDERTFVSLNYLMETTIVPKYNYRYNNKQVVTSGFASYSTNTGASVVCTADSSTETKQGLNLVCVVMGATRQFAENGWTVNNYGNFDEMVALLDYTYKNFKVNRVIYDGMAMEEFPVSGGNNDAVGIANEDIDTVLPAKAQMRNLIRNVSVINGGLTAPLKKGDLIATIELWYQNSCITEAQLLCQEDVRTAADSGLTVYSALAPKADGGSSGITKAITIICAVILVPVLSYLAINSYLRSRYRAQRRRRRQARRRSR